jgi:hypothetical protein
MNPLHPKKLLLTKWTAVQPVARQKHFIVTKVVEPEVSEGTITALGQDDQPQGTVDTNPSPKARKPATTPRIEWVDIEAVHSGAVRRIPWRELRDTALWRQGWV